jgi:glutamate-1-semialdehyde aminotransferase
MIRATLAAMPTPRSQSIFERARAVIPGGVNSPVRACRSVGTDPVFIASGDGARVTDADDIDDDEGQRRKEQE